MNYSSIGAAVLLAGLSLAASASRAPTQSRGRCRDPASDRLLFRQNIQRSIDIAVDNINRAGVASKSL